MPLDAEAFIASCDGLPADVIGARALARCMAWSGGHVDADWVAKTSGVPVDRVRDHWRSITDGLADVVKARAAEDAMALWRIGRAAKGARNRWKDRDASSTPGDATSIKNDAISTKNMLEACGPPDAISMPHDAISIQKHAKSTKKDATSIGARTVRGGGVGGEVLPTRPALNPSASRNGGDAWALVEKGSGEVGRLSVRTLLAGLGVEEPSLSQLVSARLSRDAIVDEARGVLASKGVTSRAAVLVTRLRKAHGLESLKAKPLAADVAAAVSGIAKVRETRRTKR